MPQRIADYFFIVTVDPEKIDLETGEPETYISYRYPKEDYPDEADAFPEAADYFCLPGDYDVAYKDQDSRKPFISTLVFTDAHGVKKYCTILKYYEDLYINGKRQHNMFNQPLYKPISLCVIASQPTFPATIGFLKELYDHTVKVLINSNRSLSEIDHTPSSKTPTASILSPRTALEAHKSVLLSSNNLSDCSNPQRASFDDSLRRKAAIPESSMDDVPLLPFERYVSWFIDSLPYLYENICYHIPIYNNVYTLSIPPANSLPLVDPIAFKLLFSTLSSENIMLILQALLLDQYIVVHSTKLDTLTLCLDALVSLIYPCKSYSNFFSLLRRDQTGYVNCPVPTICGMHSDTFSTMDDTEFYDYSFIVHLDFNQVTVPKRGIPSLPHSMLSPYKHYFKHHLPPPSVRLLYYTDSISQYSLNEPFPSSAFMVFEVVLSLYTKGLYLEAAKRRLVAHGPEKQCVILKAKFHDDQEEDELLVLHPESNQKEKEPYHYESNPLLVNLLKSEPILLSINNVSVINRPAYKVGSLLVSSPNPTILRLQIGEVPMSQQRSSMNYTANFYQSSYLHEIEEEEEEEDIDIDLDSLDSIRLPSSTNLLIPQESVSEEMIHRYHYSYLNDHTEKDKSTSLFSKEDIFNQNYQYECDLTTQFIEGFRIRVIKTICELLLGYEDYINNEDDDNHLHPFFSEQFIASKPASMRPFLEAFVKTQVFTTLVAHTRDYKQMKEEVSFENMENIPFILTVFEILKKDPSHALDILINKLSSSSYHIRHLYISPPTSEGLPENILDKMCERIGYTFPEINESYLAQNLARSSVGSTLQTCSWRFDAEYDLKDMILYEPASSEVEEMKMMEEEEEKKEEQPKEEEKVIEEKKEEEQPKKEEKEEKVIEEKKEEKVIIQGKKKAESSSSYTYDSSYSYYDSYTYDSSYSYYDSETESEEEEKKESKEEPTEPKEPSSLSSLPPPSTSTKQHIKSLPTLEDVTLTRHISTNHLDSLPEMKSLPRPLPPSSTTEHPSSSSTPVDSSNVILQLKKHHSRHSSRRTPPPRLNTTSLSFEPTTESETPSNYKSPNRRSEKRLSRKHKSHSRTVSPLP